MAHSRSAACMRKPLVLDARWNWLRQGVYTVRVALSTKLPLLRLAEVPMGIARPHKESVAASVVISLLRGDSGRRGLPIRHVNLPQLHGSSSSRVRGGLW